MTERMVADRMPMLSYHPNYFGTALGEFAHHKECSFRAKALQNLQKGRRKLWMRPIIEREGDGLGVGSYVGDWTIVFPSKSREKVTGPSTHTSQG